MLHSNSVEALEEPEQTLSTSLLHLTETSLRQPLLPFQLAAQNQVKP